MLFFLSNGNFTMSGSNKRFSLIHNCIKRNSPLIRDILYAIGDFQTLAECTGRENAAKMIILTRCRHSHAPFLPVDPFLLLRCPPKCCIARCRQERQFVPLHFVNSVPPRCNTPLSPFDLSIPPFLRTPLSLSRFSFSLVPSRVPISPRSLPFLFYLVTLRSVHDIHFVRISRGGFQARKPPPSRGSTSGKRKTSNGFDLSLSLFFRICLSSLSLSLFLSRSPHLCICISSPLIAYLSHSFPLSLSSPLLSFAYSLSLSLFLSIFLSPLSTLCLSTERWWSRG